MSFSIQEHCMIKPKNLAVSIPQVKEFLKITYDQDDEVLRNMVNSAASRFEKYTSQALIYQTWRASYRQLHSTSIILPVLPAVEVKGIELVSVNENVSIYPLKHASLDVDTGEVKFKTLPPGYTLKISYIAGYGESAEDVPADIRAALLRHVATMYEHRSLSAEYSMAVYDEFKLMRL